MNQYVPHGVHKNITSDSQTFALSNVFQIQQS